MARKNRESLLEEFNIEDIPEILELIEKCVSILY